jgi:hypothetical protein
MAADFYLLLLFAVLFIFSIIGLGLSLLVPENDAPDQPSVARRTEPAVAVAVRAPCCRYRTQTGRRGHFADAPAGHRNRVQKI